MEKRNMLLRGIAAVLNAGGSALVEIYDTVTAFKVTSQPGERGRLKARVREYERKIEKLHYDIGREVSLQGTGNRTSAAAEAAIRLATEYREKADEIKRRVREIEEKEREETLAAAGRSSAKREDQASIVPHEAAEALPIEEPTEEMLKSELLKICADRGIDANERMTKAVILELIKRGKE